jgi:hypothetical protein
MYGEMELEAIFKNKTGSNAVTTHSDGKRNIPMGTLFHQYFLYSTPINK